MLRSKRPGLGERKANMHIEEPDFSGLFGNVRAAGRLFNFRYGRLPNADVRQAYKTARENYRQAIHKLKMAGMRATTLTPEKRYKIATFLARPVSTVDEAANALQFSYKDRKRMVISAGRGRIAKIRVLRVATIRKFTEKGKTVIKVTKST